MPSHTKHFGPNRRVATGPRNKSISSIYNNARKQYEKSRKYMRPISRPHKQFPSKNINNGQSRAKIANNLVEKGVSMSNPTSKGMKQPTASSLRDRCISLEKENSFSRPIGVGKTKFKEGHAKRKREVHDASGATSLKPLPGLLQKTTDKLGQYSDSPSRLKKQASFDKGITSGKYGTTKLELSKGIHMAPKDKQDEIMIDNDKENVQFGENHKEEDTTKAKHTMDSTLSDISSYPFGRDLLDFQRDNHSMNLTFKNADSNSISKKRKEPSFQENPEALDDDSNVGVQVDNMSCKQIKKLKQSKIKRTDEGDCSCDLNHVGLEDDTTSILKNDQAKVPMSSCIEQQCYSCSKPIDKPTWSGILKIDDKKYVSLDGHLSTKSCEKAWNLSGQLLQVVEVKKLLRLEVWPKAWEVSTPTGDDIGIYLFPHEMRQDEGLDQLVREVMQNDLALRAIIGEAEMLIFPSIILPNRHQTFQGKHYLWGIFKRREDKDVVVDEPLKVVGSCEMENQQNVVLDRPNHMLLGEEPNQEMIQMVRVLPLETNNMLPPNQSTQEVQASHLKWPTNKGIGLKAQGEEGAQAEPTHVTIDATTFPASHEQVNPSMGHSTDRLVGFVVRKTPKLDRIIRELEGEGALVFAMQGEMIGGGSWASSKATPTQK